jgi:VWFA-related protein
MHSTLTARAAAVAALALALLPSPRAIAQSSDDEIRLRGSEVLLDMVVVDKKNRPITDVRPEEIEILEDGVLQKVSSLSLVRVGAGGEPPGEGSRVAAVHNVNLILVVVDRGTVQQENLGAVYRAAERFVEERLATNDLVAVFTTTSRLTMLQNFTHDKRKLLDALKRATTGGSIQLQESLSPDARRRIATDQTKAEGPPPNLSAEAGPVNEYDAELHRKLDDAAAGIDTTFVAIRDRIQALAVVEGVLALTKLYASVGGRKSILLYSEGFVVGDDADGAFKAMVGAANRGNFAIYPVSAGGLAASAPTGNVMPRPGTPIEESEQRMAVSGGESGLDRMTRPGRTDNDQALARLASETGGVLVRNTNDLGRGFETIANDLRSYYLASYSPTNDALDGTFRRIEVRVARKDATVRARTGYYAIPGGAGELALPDEQPALAMLARARSGESPSDLAITVKTERFPDARAWLMPVVVGVDARDLTPIGAPGEEEEFAVTAVALVRDASGEVVAKLSRPARFRAARSRLEEFRRETLTLPPFDETPRLAPGRYSLEIALYDPTSKRGGVVMRNVTLPAVAASGVALGSVVLSRGAEPVGSSAARRDDPFRLGEVRILPTAPSTFSKQRGDKLVAYFALRGAPHARYRSQLQFARAGKTVVSTPVEPLPETDAAGLARAAPVVPLGGFEPGDYRLVLVVLGDGSEPVATTFTSFRVE